MKPVDRDSHHVLVEIEPAAITDNVQIYQPVDKFCALAEREYSEALPFVRSFRL